MGTLYRGARFECYRPMTTAQIASRQRDRGRRPVRPGASPEFKCRRKFLRSFPGGFADETYLEWERNYKWSAHERWEELLGRERLPKQTRVLTWPVVTVIGFLAQPDRHIFLKPNVTRAAANAYGFPFDYTSRPNWATYQSLLAFAERVRRDQEDLGPRDMIDLQSFIWVQGSDEY